MADLFVSNELQTYLVAQAVAQLPQTAPSLTVPSVWTLPRSGAAKPRKSNGTRLENATVTLSEQVFNTPNGPADVQDAYIDVIVRARKELDAKTIHRRICELLIDPADGAGQKRLWTMHSLLVEYSGVWRVEQTVDFDEDGYTRVAAYRFGCRRKSLRGLPYTS